MSDYDVSIDDQIDALHAEAEELRDLSRHPDMGPLAAASLIRKAMSKTRQAARLRAQAGGE